MFAEEGEGLVHGRTGRLVLVEEIAGEEDHVDLEKSRAVRIG